MSDDDDRQRRLDELRGRVRSQLKEEGVEFDDEDSDEEPDDSDSSGGLMDRIERRRRRVARRRALNRERTRKAVEQGEDATLARLPAALRERAEEDWVRNLAVLLVVVGSLLGVSSGMLLVSSDPRDLISSPLFEAQQSVDLHGLVLTDLDAENSTGGEPVEGVQVELLHLADDTSEARTQTGPDGRFTFTDLPRKEMLLRVTHAGNVTIERTLVPGDLPEVTLTLRVGVGVDERDLRTESGLGSAVQLSTAIAFLSLVAAGLGFAGATEARRGLRYRRTQLLCGLGLFSRGNIFFGPLLILMGMALLMIARPQFLDQHRPYADE